MKLPVFIDNQREREDISVGTSLRPSPSDIPRFLTISHLKESETSESVIVMEFHYGINEKQSDLESYSDGPILEAKYSPKTGRFYKVKIKSAELKNLRFPTSGKESFLESNYRSNMNFFNSIHSNIEQQSFNKPRIETNLFLFDDILSNIQKRSMVVCP